MNVFLLGHVDHKMQSIVNFWNFFHVVVLSLSTPPSHFSHITISVFKSKTNFQITSQLTRSQNLHLHLSASKCPKFLLQIRVPHSTSILFISIHGVLLRQLSVYSFSSIDFLAENWAEEGAESANFEFGVDDGKRCGGEAVAAAE